MISTPVHQAIASWTTGTSFTATITAPADGNALIMCDVGNNNATGISSISQTGATWPMTGPTCVVSRHAEIQFALNVSGAGTSATVNLSGTPTISNDVNISEYSGIATSSALGPTNSNSGAGSVDTLTVTPIAGRNVLLISSARPGGTVTGGPAPGWTALTSPDSSSRAFMAYQLVASASGPYSNQYTNTGGFGAVIAAFYAPAAAGAPLIVPEAIGFAAVGGLH